MARVGDTSIVIDTAGLFDSDRVPLTPPGADSARPDSPAAAAAPQAPPPNPFTLPSGRPRGSSDLGVLPSDVIALRMQEPVVPVAGVTADDLADSFDELRGGTRRHNALDIMAARNTPVVAAVDGKILKLHNSPAGGVTIYMSDPTERYVLLYGHLEKFRARLAEGASVKRGEIIGFVGSSGNASPLAPHLHFAIARNDNMRDWWKGNPLNPFLLYRGR